MQADERIDESIKYAKRISDITILTTQDRGDGFLYFIDSAYKTKSVVCFAEAFCKKIISFVRDGNLSK